MTVKIKRTSQSQEYRDKYYLDLLDLALKSSIDKYGPYKLIRSKMTMVQSRSIKMLEKSNKTISILWTMTSKTREKELAPIRIPLLKGLMGHRILIIAFGNQNKFDRITNIEELSKLTAIQGHDWPDTEILKAAGIKINTSSAYNGMFKMVASKRVDYFPRGIVEIYGEIKNQKNPALTIEKNILIKYPAPMYFFTNKKDTILNERIRYGLRKSIKNGEFDKLFFGNPNFSQLLDKSNLRNRRVFEIANPLLPVETPLEDKSLWFKIKL